ncbi:LysM peptidoglycan-binding domain-containing protein [Haematomicrobium sanguinis]|uniref:LysM peptidoglycan-binding domain-containing protein n=1 Tax=Haematomicrobium sanguinis TaxID=479106 RepID=UPI00068ADE75|nr:hypothetical protein [Haematomicrobium sanguinis]
MSIKCLDTNQSGPVTNAGDEFGPACQSRLHVADVFMAALFVLCAFGLIAVGTALLALTPQEAPLTRVEYLIGLTAATLGATLALWWIVAAALSLWLAQLERHISSPALRGRFQNALASISRKIAPSFMRRLATAVLGASLIGTSAATASFAEPVTFPSASVSPTATVATALLTSQGAPAPDPTIPAPGTPDPNPLWTPSPEDTSGSALIPDTSRDVETAMVPGTKVVVDVGDSLWSLASRQLGGFATNADIARLWPAWYEANKSVIGEDPDLILPGQVLTVPEPVQSR